MQGATDPTPVQPGQGALSVVVQHEQGGVLIHVAAPGGRQGDLDTGSVVAFLSALDAEQLEKDALGDLGMLEDGGEVSFAQAMLNRMITIAKGEW